MISLLVGARARSELRDLEPYRGEGAVRSRRAFISGLQPSWHAENALTPTVLASFAWQVGLQKQVATLFQSQAIVNQRVRGLG